MWIFLEKSIFRHMVMKMTMWYFYGKKYQEGIYGSDLYERTAGFEIDFIDGVANGNFYDGKLAVQYCG